METADKIGHLVETPRDLEKCLAAVSEADARAVVVFHNGEKGITFGDGTTMTLSKFAEEFGSSHPAVISCETYNFLELPYRTTVQLSIDSTVEASQLSKQRCGDEPISFDRFLESFVTYYNRDELVKKFYVVVGVSGVTGASGGGVCLAVYAGKRSGGTGDRK